MPEHVTQSVLAEIVSIAADAIICMDEKQIITYFNAGAEIIFGWMSSEIVGQRIEVLIPEKFRASHEEQVHAFGRSEVKARRMGERREIAGLRKNGETFPAEAAISQVHQEGVTVYAVALRDVSVRHRFERRQSFLAYAGERFATSFKMEDTFERVMSLAVPTLADGCVIEGREDRAFRLDAVGHLDPSVLKSLLRLRGTKPRIPPTDHPFQKMIQNEQPILLRAHETGELLRIVAEDGYRDALKGARSVLFLPMMMRGQLIAVLVLFRTEREFDSDDVAFAGDFARLTALAIDNARLHETLLQNLRSRDEMISIVSHDLRNPVAAVKMLSKAISSNVDNQSFPGLENVFLMWQAADQMESLIRDLLDISRLDSGNLRLQLEPIDPVVLIHDSLRTLLPLATEGEVTLHNRVSGKFSRVNADVDRIQQVLSNLVGNALKFTPPGGDIVVAASETDGGLLVTVKDSGKGIAPDHLHRVFERYWQSSRTDRQGAGLGLPIAKGIIEAHGGKISIESAAENGTTVSFTLPLASDSDTE